MRGPRDWREWFSGLHAAGAARADDDTRARLTRARELIERDYHQPLDLAAMARAASFSPFHFQRQFRRAFDETPHQALTRRRLERARELLIDSDLSVTEICFEVGFHSLGSFSALFHRRVGHSPQRYRRRLVQCLGVAPIPAIPSCFLRAFGPPSLTA